jgi:type IV pilus assembly protein PilA
MTTFCAGCGSSVSADDKFCRVCGRTVSPDSAVMPASSAPQAGPAETSGKAVASLVCGLLSLILPFAVAAVILGHLSLSEIRKSAGRIKGDGLAITGLVLGYAGVAALPVILIVAAIAIPNLLRARMAANEASAVTSVRTLNVAEIAYSQAHLNSGFTCSLSDLGGDQLITRELASGRRYGYVFELSDCAAGTEGAGNAKYRIVAYPATPNQTGVRAFCSDESTVIKVDSSGSGQGCMQSGSALQ